MNIQEYISSGIIESYVLGLASPEERVEFERLCLQYPELAEARTAFEISLEKQAMDNAILPPGETKEKILNAVLPSGKPVARPLSNSWWKFAAAACFILLLGTIYFNISLSNKNNRLAADNKNLKNNYEETLAALNDLKKDMAVLQQNPRVKMASLKGMEAAPQAYATVYWDTSSHDVYLLANNLPAPPGDMQYQLWALLNGKPIDLGMMDYEIKQKRLLIRMKNAREAQAFAITLEKKNRPDPSTPAGAMYVMGGL